MLERPVDEVGGELLDSQPLELGRDLPAVVGRVVDNVPQHDPWGRVDATEPRSYRPRRGQPQRSYAGTSLSKI